MIISHKYKFIFIKTKKTAGTSLKVFLSQCCSEEDIVTPIYPHVEPHCARNYNGIWNPIPEIIQNKKFKVQGIINSLKRKNKFYNHIPASLVKQRTPKKIWNSYFKFCVERNPWDKTLSHYHMQKSRSESPFSLDNYIKNRRFCINYNLYEDKNKLLVDKVLKYESLIDELTIIFKNLGIPFDGSLGVRAKSEYRKDRRPYQEVFSNEQRDIIQTAYAREIKRHNYTF